MTIIWILIGLVAAYFIILGGAAYAIIMATPDWIFWALGTIFGIVWLWQFYEWLSENTLVRLLLLCLIVGVPVAFLLFVWYR